MNQPLIDQDEHDNYLYFQQKLYALKPFLFNYVQRVINKKKETLSEEQRKTLCYRCNPPIGSLRFNSEVGSWIIAHIYDRHVPIWWYNRMYDRDELISKNIEIYSEIDPSTLLSFILKSLPKIIAVVDFDERGIINEIHGRAERVSRYRNRCYGHNPQRLITPAVLRNCLVHVLGGYSAIVQEIDELSNKISLYLEKF
jgi:hypothetical protein